MFEHKYLLGLGLSSFKDINIKKGKSQWWDNLNPMSMKPKIVGRAPLPALARRDGEGGGQNYAA
jgi:hypothetical protein